MKNNLLVLAVATACALPTFADAPDVQRANIVQKQIPAPVKAAYKVLGTRKLADHVVEKQIEIAPGLKMKVVSGIERHNNVINPQVKAAAPVAAPEGFSLYENFEGWDGVDAAWLPEGWTVDHKDSPAGNRGWKITQPLNAMDYITSKCVTYEVFTNPVDEWLITPEISVSKGMILSWESMPTVYFFDWDYTIHSTQPLTADDIINDLLVNISTDGGETWKTVYSSAEELIKATNGRLFSMFDYTMRPFSYDLADYAGQNVKIAFQIKGKDGNTNFIDNVTVGLPPTQTSYRAPLSSLYFGLSQYDNMFPLSIMVGPVFQPTQFYNKTATRDAESLWTYTDTEGEHTSTDRNLNVTYKTNYTDENTTLNNVYEYPELTARTELTAPISYQKKGYYQAGGKGEWKINIKEDDGSVTSEILQLGLTVADPVTEGTATYADIVVPYFGYNVESDRFWSRQTFGEDFEPDNDNWNHLEYIGDYFYSPASPMVINGVRLNGYGKINAKNVKMRAEIYLLDAAFRIRETPDYVALCRPEDITVIDRSSASDYLSFEFKFDEPIVLSTAVAPYFIVTVTGFRDAENVDYFSPEMSDLSNENNLGLGWIGLHSCIDGQEGPISWSSVTRLTGDQLVSFYIMLDAAFPWLETETDEISLSSQNVARLNLDSYHDGADLTVEGLPEWLNASVTGRYGETAIEFTADNVPAEKPDVKATVKGHGVSKELTIHTRDSAVGTIVSDASAEGVPVYYTLDGKRVNPANLRPGIYLKRQGTQTTKHVVR